MDNSIANTLVLIAGIHSLVAAIFHLTFPRLFQWHITLQSLSNTNKAIMKILNIQLIIYFLMIGVLFTSSYTSILENPIGRFVLLGNGIFYTVRFVLHFVYFKINSSAHYILIIAFLVGMFCSLYPVVTNIL